MLNIPSHLQTAGIAVLDPTLQLFILLVLVAVTATQFCVIIFPTLRQGDFFKLIHTSQRFLVKINFIKIIRMAVGGLTGMFNYSMDLSLTVWNIMIIKLIQDFAESWGGGAIVRKGATPRSSFSVCEFLAFYTHIAIPNSCWMFCQ